jgi:ribosome-binding protein aMBF1 (putative translation factor)
MARTADDGRWSELRDQRLGESGATAAYDAARLASELGAAVRARREQRGWSQAQLAGESGMTQSAVARFEGGGTVPTIPVLQRLAAALGTELIVRLGHASTANRRATAPLPSTPGEVR